MNQSFPFTFQKIKAQYQYALDIGYQFITCEKYFNIKNKITTDSKIIVNRIDIDFSVKKTKILVDIFNSLNIKGSFFIRLHATEYNPFSFENYKIIKYLIESGHELGYHSEIIDQAAIWDEPADKCLRKDIDILNLMFDTNIRGVASHGGITGLNNLDFWKTNKAADFGLLYEAYDENAVFDLFNTSFYISDSEWTRWKCYNKGKKVDGDHRNLIEHLTAIKHNLVYLLIHPDTYYFQHIYE
jgi:hypothetical protein